MIRCKNSACNKPTIFRRSTTTLQYAYQMGSGQDTARAAVSCPVCKHVYMYEELEMTPIPSREPQEQGGSQKRHPTLAVVRLLCGTAGCALPLEVYAARESDSSLAAIEIEMEGWTFHNLRCPNGHPLQGRNGES
jgi:hypothetical protein